MLFLNKVAGINFRLLLFVFLVSVIFLITPTEVFAVVQNLNGQSGRNQTFLNDSNIIINSLDNTHSLGWQGLLPLSRGGTGVSSLDSGSLLFSNGSSIIQDNSNLFWDDINDRLGVGTNEPKESIDIVGSESGGGSIAVTSQGVFPVGLIMYNGTEERGGIGLSTGSGYFANESTSDDLILYSYNPSGTSRLMLATGDTPNARLTITGTGDIGIATVNPSARLDVVGTIKGDSTLFLGNSATPGCIAMADSDGAGTTYVTANDGVLSASPTKPSFCQ